MADPRLARPLWRGRRNVDALTIAALERAEEIAGHEFVVTQGSYNPGGVGASAGTHDLGGVIDLRWTGNPADVVALRRAGFAAWHRRPEQAGRKPWPHHIHAVVIDHPYLAPLAAQQVRDYRAGRNGLANSGPDDAPRPANITAFPWEDYMATSNELLKAIKENTAEVKAMRAELADARKAIGARVSKEATGLRALFTRKV